MQLGLCSNALLCFLNFVTTAFLNHGTWWGRVDVCRVLFIEIVYFSKNNLSDTM